MLLFYDFQSFFHYFSFFLVYFDGILKLQAVPIDGTLIPSRVQNFRARYDHSTDAIYIQWLYPEETQNEEQVEFVVRYRITNRPDSSSDFDWKYSQVGTDLEARLDLNEIRNGDELQAQVRAERPDGTVLEDWSQSLLISITKSVYIDGIPAADDDLLPPLDFQAHILNTSLVRLEWTPPFRALSSVPTDHYYIVNVKQLTSDDRSPLLRQQVKVQANSFTLSNLKPGQRYELTIRTASSPERISSVAAIVEITMPREDEYFEVGNLIISSHFKGSGEGTVNLTWEVPEKMQNRIQAYDLEYSEAGTEDWHQLQFSGSHPAASLTTLKGDTEYLLKIRTHLANNLTTESGQFRFRTPAVIKNPIKKVDVIYTHEISGVRLQWTLENFLSAHLIDGYDVYISDNPDLPDAEWSYYPVSGSGLSNNAFASASNSLVVSDLRPDHTYYVRVNVRKKDGEVLRAPSIYRFKTMGRSEFLERRAENVLAYRLLSPGRVQITWTYPSSVLPTITGSAIMYAESNTSPTNQWERIILDNPLQNSVVLERLKPNSYYFVRILPQINNTFYDSSVIDTFEIRTGPESISFLNMSYIITLGRTQFSHPDSSNSRMLSQHEVNQESMTTRWRNEKLTLNACNPDSIKDECLWDERCIPITEGRFYGLCIPTQLRNAIINN
uniref:Protein-tyrosine-phosphatase n=1 Tax=Elaeophora elaphi TaxID=1147741 RepID=A0A0R3RJ54_9BILA